MTFLPKQAPKFKPDPLEIASLVRWFLFLTIAGAVCSRHGWAIAWKRLVVEERKDGRLNRVIGWK